MRPPTTVTLTVYDSQGHSDSVQHTITYADPDEPYKVGLHFAFYQGHGYAYKVLMPVSPHECALNRLLGRAGKLLLSGTPTSLTSGHRLTTTVSCPGDCIGTLYALRPGRTKPRVLGKTSFVVHTGKRKHKLTIQLNKTGRLLARASRLRRVTLLVLIRGQKPRAVTVRVRRKNR